ncbi:MAG: MetS family NSS transporter small subunit [Acidobacteria bacterium]|nr:MetS family NSS transporter small subunit [Acidobacteriota bacterium]
MELGTIVMMVLVIGFVWGGFAVLLIKSMRADANKTD